RHSGKLSLPVRSGESLPNELDLVRIETPGYQRCRIVSAQQPVQNCIRLGVADSEISFVRLTFDQIRRRGLANDHIGNAKKLCELPDLRLEQIAERIDRWGVVG